MQKNGFALALTLWIVAIMSLVTALYLSYGKTVVQKTIKLHKKLEVTLEAESTIEILKFFAATGYFANNRIINNTLSKEFKTFPNILKINGDIHHWKNQKILLEDSSAFVNVNDKEAFIKYLAYQDNNIKDNEGIIRDSMNDWLDFDDFSGLNGAEESFYQRNKVVYSSRNENYFSSVSEVFLIRGLNSYSSLEQEKLQEELILLDYVSRNILTMSIDRLGKVYHFTKTELEQLSEARKENSKFFIQLFNKFNMGNENYELDGFKPSKILKMTVESSFQGISKKITLLINFQAKRKHAFEVLEYKD